MAKRRGRGEGSISQRADGRWQARVDLGRGANGQRRRKTIYGSTRAAVSSRLNILLGKSETGELLGTSTPTVASWLNHWHRTHFDDWRPSTQRLYRHAIDQWIVPTLGPVRLEQLKPAAIQKWINDATAAGPRARTAMAHTVLQAALKFAMRQRVITYNPAALVRVPRPERQKIAPLSAVQARALLDAAGEQRYGAMVVTSLTLGLRIGEASGLTWADVDLTAGTLRVRQQIQVMPGGTEIAPLKTAMSRRTLTMPALLVDALKAHRVRQLEDRMKAGAAGLKAGDLVFATDTGRPVHPHYIRTHVLAPMLKAAGLPAARFHSLRHTAATLLLGDGVPLFDVSRVLGHSKIATTADTYGHLVDEMAAGAAVRMDALLKRQAKG